MNNPIMYSDESGHSPDSIWKKLLGVVGVGLAVVTVAAVVASGGTLLVPVLVGAGVGAGLNLVGQGVSNLSQGKGFFEDINWGNVALGGLSGAAFATGVGDYVNMARVDGAGFLSRSAVALMSKLYTMGPTSVTGVGRGVTKFVGNYIGDWF